MGVAGAWTVSVFCSIALFPADHFFRTGTSTLPGRLSIITYSEDRRYSLRICFFILFLVTVFSQTFLFIRPTAANLASYERWSGSEIQSHTWLGDMADEVVKVDLREGNTMIIPTGWIHAVVR